jgi:hypothetical protein
MALSKTFALPSGVSATYNRVMSSTVDQINQQLTINVGQYLSAAQYTINPSAPLAIVSIQIPLSELPQADVTTFVGWMDAALLAYTTQFAGATETA